MARLELYIQTKIIQPISMLVGLHRSFSSGPIDCCKTHLNTSDGSPSSPVSFPHTTHTGLGARLRAQQRHVYTHILTLFPISLNICVLFCSSEVVASKHSADKWTWWLVTHQDTKTQTVRPKETDDDFITSFAKQISLVWATVVK